MKKIVMLLAMGLFVGTLSYSSYAAVNGVVVENVGDDKKKKKKKKDACCSKDAKTAEVKGTEGKTCDTKATSEKKACCSKSAEKK